MMAPKMIASSTRSSRASAVPGGPRRLLGNGRVVPAPRRPTERVGRPPLPARGPAPCQSSASSPAGGESTPEARLETSEPRPKSREYLELEACEVFRVSDGARMRLTDAWSEDERALVAFGRSFG